MKIWHSSFRSGENFMISKFDFYWSSLGSKFVGIEFPSANASSVWASEGAVDMKMMEHEKFFLDLR